MTIIMVGIAETYLKKESCEEKPGDALKEAKSRGRSFRADGK
jgi:hypothetical protein